MQRINAMGERTRRAIVQHLTRRTPKTITELIKVTFIFAISPCSICFTIL